MKELKGKKVIIHDGDLRRRENENRNYLMRLTSDNLLFNYRVEAGRFSGRGIPAGAHEGWESPVCQIRGHFLGHWLSAAALHYNSSKDTELKAKADRIIDELAECQKDNGGQWVGPIPEKYLHWIAKGKFMWAPQYNLHKLFMGLVDMYIYMENSKALEIADHFADWFIQWTDQFSREKLDEILDVETGGMLEVWADLLHITGDKKYEVLLERYYRSRLFNPLLEGKDPLTNMHANTTIPEVLGCARAYEITGEDKWLEIVKAYWTCAVTDRGYLATGGQTAGEVWMPKQKMKARLGDKNQEHCTVYNMMRLAEFLFRQTASPEYLHYMEYNLFNGIMAQAYYSEYYLTGNHHNHPHHGLLTYFLPMKAGLRKDWAKETDSFFCCHGTMVQANAAFNRNIYYQDGKKIYICQYFNSEVIGEVEEGEFKLVQSQDNMSGSMLVSSNTAGYNEINEVTARHENMPNYRKYDITVHSNQDQNMELAFRIPDWIMNEASIYLNDELYGKTCETSEFYVIDRNWKNGDKISIILPIGIRFIPLPDDENMGAFRFGPEVLAGLCSDEKILYIEDEDICSEIEMENEREWGAWRYFFKTKNQNPAIQLKRIRDIGYEQFQIYFPIKRNSK